MERYTKKSFFSLLEREDLVDYWKTFLEEIKSLLPYFVKFLDNGTILYKNYIKKLYSGLIKLIINYYDYR